MSSNVMLDRLELVRWYMNDIILFGPVYFPQLHQTSLDKTSLLVHSDGPCIRTADLQP